MARIRGQKRKWKTEEKVDLNAPLPSPRASINPSSDWWENFSTRFSGYTPDSFFKVSRKTFEYICGLVEEEMMIGQNCMDQRREFLTLNDRVAIALTRLSSGESFGAVGDLFRVSISTVSHVTWRFVEAIEKKGFQHLHWPKTEEQITEIKSKFERINGLPNCCGAIDTTSIVFCLSSDHPSRKIWCDRENNGCMNLQAVVDPDMRFLDIIAGLPGSLSEPDVLCEWSLFNLCEEGKRLNGKKLKLAENKEEIGEYIVGNGGFPLLPWLLTPYNNQEKKLCDVKEDFNKRHYETWKVAKMAFKCLKETWQVIQGVLWTPDKHKLPRIIYACCVLHNIMIDQNDGFIMQDQSFLQSADDNSAQVHQQKCKFQDKTASVHRDNLALYLSAKLPPFSSNGIESDSASETTVMEEVQSGNTCKEMVVFQSTQRTNTNAGNTMPSSSAEPNVNQSQQILQSIVDAVKDIKTSVRRMERDMGTTKNDVSLIERKMQSYVDQQYKVQLHLNNLSKQFKEEFKKIHEEIQKPKPVDPTFVDLEAQKNKIVHVLDEFVVATNTFRLDNQSVATILQEEVTELRDNLDAFIFDAANKGEILVIDPSTAQKLVMQKKISRDVTSWRHQKKAG